MAIAKQLVPGIHQMGMAMHWEGKTARPMTIEESREVAEKVADNFRSFEYEMAEVRAEIERVTGLPFHMLAS